MRSITIIILFFTCVGVKAHNPPISKHKYYIDYLHFGYGHSFNFDNISLVLKYYYEDYIDFENNVFLSLSTEKISIHIEKNVPLSLENTWVVLITRKARSGYLFVNKYFAEWLNSHVNENEDMVILYHINGVELSTRKDAMSLIGLKRRRIKDVSIYRSETNKIIIDIILSGRREIAIRAKQE